MTLHAYLPQDRLRALSRGETLPDRTRGSALFADISGFTQLTEALRETLGSRKGAEELTRHLDTVYTALIGEVEKCGGSVLGFAGDAITCWFDGAEDSAPRAASCAFGLQRAMDTFQSIKLPNGKTTSLSLKVSVATGDARRLVVGDPDIHYIDALAGATVARTSTAEHLANKGEILVDEATVNTLGDSLAVKEWRNAESGEKFAVASGLNYQLPITNYPGAQPLEPEQLKAWIDKTVYERETAGQASFLTEFRPCAVLFINFAGIDYDADEAQTQLDAFIRQMQRIAARYEGAVLQLTIGDKGSYAYVNFGALAAQEDDTRRAIKAALELRNKTDLPLQIGITQGVMRVGAYGGQTRQTFGALGDDVNLAARLMTNAKVGDILISGYVHKTLLNDFVTEPQPALGVKGKAKPITVFKLIQEQRQRAIRLQEPNYALPMVGRADELKLIEEKLDLAKQGKSQVIGIVAEAGLGKSRLVAEVIRSARKKGFVGYGGACQSDAIHTPYQAWKSIWGAFFDVDHEMPLRKQMRFIEGEIEDRAPSRVDAMPLLNVVLDLNIPENEFTQNLEPKIRQSALHALLEDCLKAASKDEPLLIVIEDMHWVDALSHDLLEQLAKALANYPVCFMLAYRPLQMTRLEKPRLEAFEQFTRVELHELTQSEAESAIRAKLAQLYPARGGALAGKLMEMLMARSQGNPFYLEELLNYMHDRELDPTDIQNIELPNSLHTLILSRIDKLSELEKTTLRVASIIGRLFRARWLTGYYPELGTFPQVKTALDALDALEITPLDSPEPEMTYLFKHIVTHEVTYESLPFATRARLHEQLAVYLEKLGAESMPPLETLAFHYRRSDNTAKQIEYLLKAGEAAQKNFANDAALAYYEQLLPLLKNAREQTEIRLMRGKVLEVIGKWDEAERNYHTALEIAKDDLALEASVQFALGALNRWRGNYASALDWLEMSNKTRMKLEDKRGLAQVFIETGAALWSKGEYDLANESLNKGLALAREVGDKMKIASAFVTLGLVSFQQGNYATARAMLEDSLALNREMGHKWGVGVSTLNLGTITNKQGDYVAAQALYEESLVIWREMGDKRGVSVSLINLGNVANYQGDFTKARRLYEESLALKREIGDKRGVSISLINLGFVTWNQGDNVTARALCEESLTLARQTDDKTGIAYCLLCLGLVDLVENKPQARENILSSLHLRQEMGEQATQTSSLVGVAGLALQSGNATQAAQWLGAIESALKVLDAVLEPDVMPFHKQTLAVAREQLGDSAFMSAWEEGGKWSLEEAVKRALGE